jgi:hypothetical protein
MTTATMAAPASKGWNIGLWVATVLLALLYVMGVQFHLFTAPEQAAEMGAVWMTEYPLWFPRMIGVIEIIGIVGLILPAALRIKPHLSVLATWGLLAIQVLAILFHGSRGEFEALPFNAIYVVLAVFVLWGRTKKAPILPKA